MKKAFSARFATSAVGVFCPIFNFRLCVLCKIIPLEDEMSGDSIAYALYRGLE